MPGRAPSVSVQASPVSVALKPSAPVQRGLHRVVRVVVGGDREGQELVDRVGGDRRGDDQRVPGRVHRVPVVHRRLLDLVAGHEGDVLLPPGPGPAGRGLVGLAEHLDEAGGPGHEGVDQLVVGAPAPGRRDSAGGASSRSSTIVPQNQCTSVRCQTRSATDQPGQCSTRASRWPRVASANPALCTVIAAIESNVESVMPAT